MSSLRNRKNGLLLFGLGFREAVLIHISASAASGLQCLFIRFNNRALPNLVYIIVQSHHQVFSSTVGAMSILPIVHYQSLCHGDTDSPGPGVGNSLLFQQLLPLHRRLFWTGIPQPDEMALLT